MATTHVLTTCISSYRFGGSSGTAKRWNWQRPVCSQRKHIRSRNHQIYAKHWTSLDWFDGPSWCIVSRCVGFCCSAKRKFVHVVPPKGLSCRFGSGNFINSQARFFLNALSGWTLCSRKSFSLTGTLVIKIITCNFFCFRELIF